MNVKSRLVGNWIVSKLLFVVAVTCLIRPLQAFEAVIGDGSIAQASSQSDNALPNSALVQTVPVANRSPENGKNTISVQVAFGEGNIAVLFPVIRINRLAFLNDDKKIALTGSDDDVLGQRIPRTSVTSVEVDFIELAMGTDIGRGLKTAAQETPELVGKKLVEPRLMMPLTVQLVGYDRKTGKSVNLSESLELPRSVDTTAIPTIAFQIYPDRASVLQSMKQSDLRVSIATAYRARLSNDQLVIHGRAVAESVASVADSIEQRCGKKARILAVVLGEGGIERKSHVQRLSKSMVEVTIEKKVDANVAPELVRSNVASLLDSLMEKAYQQFEANHETLAYLMPDGKIVSIAVNEIRSVQDERYKELEEFLATRNSSSGAFNLSTGETVGLGPLSLGKEFDIGGQKSEAEARDSAKKQVKQLRQSLQGNLKSLSGIDIDFLANVSGNDNFSVVSKLADYRVGSAELRYQLSFNGVPTSADIAIDAPTYPVGAVIVQDNGLVAFVRYQSNGIYLIEDEFGSATAVAPKADGTFEAWGKAARFEADGSITWPKNKWLKKPSEAFAFYRLSLNGAQCSIRCDERGGLEMIDEHGRRGFAVFSQSSREFVVQEWEVKGSILPGGVIKWPESRWTH